MTGIKRPQSRVVPKEDLWDILKNPHTELSHAGRDRMHAHFIEHMYLIPREVTSLYVRICNTCQAIKGRKSIQKIIHKPIIQEGVGVRRQADLVDLQLSPDAGYKFILNYRDCFSKFDVLRPLSPKLQMRWHNAWCISSVSTVPLISCTRIMAPNSRIRHCSPFYTGYGRAHVSYTGNRVTQKIREVWRALMPIS